MSHDYVALLGNGVSLAYSPQLRVANLTTELANEFDKLGASEADVALKKLAEESRLDPLAGFESMLGPLETTARSLEALTDLAPLAATKSAAADVEKVRRFVETVHRTGLSIVLGKIAEYSKGAGATSFGAVDDFIHGLVSLAEPKRLSVATLNYDGLTHAGLLKHGSPADLALGYKKGRHEVVIGKPRINGLKLRSVDDIPQQKSPIIQLHGSLGWLRSPDTGVVWSFNLEDLRKLDYWNELKKGTATWTPVVVLTDQKERTVMRRPFALAYDILQDRLVSSNRWLVAGYGLGDKPVNELFRTAFATRKRLQLPEP